MSNFHIPVLLQEVIGFLGPKEGKRYIDATLGGGGHGFEILKLGGIVLGIDLDQEAINYTLGRWKIECRKWNVQEKNLTLVQGNFRDIDTIAHLNKFDKLDGILFDFGVSSHQLDTQSRGFSFQKEGPLDMRMDASLDSAQAVKALDLVNALSRGELLELFTKLGEEPVAIKIAEGIVKARNKKPIETTQELAHITRQAYAKKHTKIHPASRVFQALRIAVNDELNNIREALPKALELLESKGRLITISFHSLEDRIVKETFKDFEEKGLGRALTKKPIVPSENEVNSNVRSRSAKLRVFEKS